MAVETGVPPGTWTLIFSGSTLIQSHIIQSLKTDVQRLTQEARRQNLWSNTVIIDGRYPAQVWTHEFLLYTEASTPLLFAEKFFDLDDKFTEAVQQLTLQDNLVDRINFGSCLMAPPSLENPREMLLFRAGFLRISFVGNTKPTLL